MPSFFLDPGCGPWGWGVIKETIRGAPAQPLGVGGQPRLEVGWVDDLQRNNLLLQGQIQEHLVVRVSHQGRAAETRVELMKRAPRGRIGHAWLSGSPAAGAHHLPFRSGGFAEVLWLLQLHPHPGGSAHPVGLEPHGLSPGVSGSPG